MGRYYGSEALRNPKIQKKALDFALDQLSPMIHNVGSQALDELSIKIRPKKNYKTNRKDLDGGAVDIHKLIGKLPHPAGGWTLVDVKCFSQIIFDLGKKKQKSRYFLGIFYRTF